MLSRSLFVVVGVAVDSLGKFYLGDGEPRRVLEGDVLLRSVVSRVLV